MSNKPRKIIFAGLAQNCARFLPDVFRNIENIAKHASEAAYIFIENDSTDSTKNDLIVWGQNKVNFKFIDLDGLNQINIRTLRLEYARNIYLETIKADPYLRDFDVLVLIDMDDVGAYPVNISAIVDALNYLESADDIAGVFANQIGTYYDMWALRHPMLCPKDIWEEVFDYAFVHHCPDQEAFDNTFAKRILSIDKDQDYIEVDSGFGGLGFYKLKFVINNPNPYLGSKIKVLQTHPEVILRKWQVCEHVHFHQGIRNQGGRLVISPKLINGANAGINFPASCFITFLF